MLMSIFLVASSYYLPSSDAPKVNLTLHDTDGVKTVSVGETAEYAILVENEGSTRAHIEFSREGTASGWQSTLSHETLNLQAGDTQLVSLYVTPTDEDAASSIDVNVMATRGDNVTVVYTTTYLDGTVLIRKSGEIDWTPFTKDSEIVEGDNLKTEVDSRVQVAFEHLIIVLFPLTEIHITHMNILGEDATYEFHLHQGRASFDIDLPTTDSVFTLRTANGARVITSATQTMTFMAEAGGDILVFRGQVPYYPPPTRQGDPDGATNISQGMDSSGNRFNYIELKYDNEIVSGILENIQHETIGFDNDGDFVGSGDIDGFVFRFPGTDLFYVFGLDIASLTLELSQVKPGRFDLSFSRFSPDKDGEVHLRGFVFENMNSPSEGTIRFVFRENQVTLFSDTRLTYDFGVRYKETQRFYLNDMSTEAGQGNIFQVLNYVHLQNEEVNVVLFGRDKDNDGSFEDDVIIHTGMSGKEVYDDLDDEDEGTGYVLIAVIVVILIIVAMYFIIQSGPGALGPGPDTDRSEVEERPETGDEQDQPLPGPGPEEPEDRGLLSDDDLGELPERGDTEPPDDMSEFLRSKEEKKIVREDWEKVDEDGDGIADTDEDEEPPAPKDYPDKEEPPVPEDYPDKEEPPVPEDYPDKEEPHAPEDYPDKEEPHAPEEYLEEEPHAPEEFAVPSSFPREDAEAPPLFIPPQPVEPPEEDDGSQILDDDEGYVDLDLDLFPEDESATSPLLTPDGEIPRGDSPEGTGEEPVGRKRIFTKEDILDSLQKVREQRKELESIASESSDEDWWENWQAEMRRDMESLKPADD